MISLKNINKDLGSFSLKNISFDLNEGEYLALLGPSGAGKTVLLELIAGLEKKDSGKIEGVDIRSIGFIYQDYMLFPHLNVSNNIAYGLRVRRINRETISEKVKETAILLHIEHILSRNVQTLSGGEKERVAIASALMIDPKLILLDEPTASLDANKRREMQKLFIDLHKKNRATFIHVTHSFEEALAVADKIIVLNEGEVLQEGSTDDVFHNPGSKFIADFIGYRNVFKGEIKSNIFSSNGVQIYTPYNDSSNIYIAIKSDDVIVSSDKLLSSARNTFEGNVIDIKKNISTVDIIANIGIEMHASITYASLEEMKLSIGSKVWLTFKSTAIGIFDH